MTFPHNLNNETNAKSSQVMVNFNSLITGSSNLQPLVGTTLILTGGSVIPGVFNLGSQAELTISGGVVTITKTYHSIDTEADAATDDLDTISGGTDGDILILRTNNSGRDVTVKDGTGNIDINGDYLMSNIGFTITLLYNGALANWTELARSN